MSKPNNKPTNKPKRAKKSKLQKSQASKKPESLLAVWGNGFGFRGPTEVYWDSQLKSWWAKNQEDEVKKPGLDWDDSESYFSFSSEDLYEVKYFIEGYAACTKVIGNALKYTRD